MRTVHVLNKWTAVVSRDLANVRAFSRAPCTLARLSNSTEKVVSVEHTSTNSFREKKKAPSLNNRFLRTWLHQLFTHATRISSKQSRPASQPGQRTLKTKGKLVRARSEKSTRGVVSNCAACVSNGVKEDPPISGRECHRRERRPRQSNATAQGKTKGANGRGSGAVTATVCVCVARPCADVPSLSLFSLGDGAVHDVASAQLLSRFSMAQRESEEEAVRQCVFRNAPASSMKLRASGCRMALGDAELFHKSVKGCRGSSLSTTPTVRPSQ